VVAVDLQIPSGPGQKIKKTMNGEKSQHVVEERHTRAEVGIPLSVQAELDLDVRFPCFSLHPSSS
jgi:hypothetical protein